MKSEIPGKGVDPEAQGLLDPEAQERRQAFLQEHETPCQSRVSASIFIASMMFIPMLIFTLAPFDSAPALGKQETRLRRDDKGYPSFLSDAGRLLPAAIHAEVLPTDAEVKATKRLVVVGDIHGCLHEFQELLKKVNYTQGEDVLFSNGDMTNKGPYSVEVIQEFRRLGGHTVRGNNDDAALASWEAWHRGVAVEDLPKKTQWVNKLPRADAEWLQQLPWTIRIPPLKLVFVHGGLIPNVPLLKQDLQSLFTVRELIQNRDGCWRMAQDKEGEHGPEWTSVYNDPSNFVIFGHDASRGLQQGPRSLGLDTGCVYGNVLTAAIVDLSNSTGPANQGDLVEKIKLYSVKAHHKYVPYKVGDPEDD